MNRRLFIKASGLAASGFLFSSCGTFSRGANNRLQLAAIGCGRMGRGDIKSLLAVADQYNAVFVAACDVDANRALEAKKLIEGFYAEAGRSHQIQIYTDYKQVLKSSAVDAVTIGTPDHSHAAVAIAAAKAKKDIYLQKPLTYTIEEGKQLIQAVRSNRCVLQTGTQQRSSIYFRRVCELVRNHKIGDLKKIEIVIPMDKGRVDFTPMAVPQNLDYNAWLGHAPFTPYTERAVHPQADFSRPGWMQVADYSHGMITNWGAHMFDIAQWGMGTDLSAPFHFEAEATFEDRGVYNVHRAFNATNRYENGIELSLRTKDAGEEIGPGVKFIGSKGWARCMRGGFEAHDRHVLRWQAGPGDVQLQVSKNHYGNFLNAVRERSEPITGVEIGHRSNSLCVINLIASKCGRPLTWDPEQEVFINDAEANSFLSNMRKS